MFKKHAQKAPYGHTVYDVVFDGRIIGTVQGGSRESGASHWWRADSMMFEGDYFPEMLRYNSSRQEAADRLVAHYQKQIALGRRPR